MDEASLLWDGWGDYVSLMQALHPGGYQEMSILLPPFLPRAQFTHLQTGPITLDALPGAF